MFISRRSFLQAGVIAAVVASTLRGALAQRTSKATQGHRKGTSLEPVPYEARKDRVFYLKRSSFAPYMNTPFRVRSTSSKGAATLTLVAVTDLHGSAAKDSEDAYSLLFTGARTKALAQDIYLFSHDALGEFTLLLVRVETRDEKHAYYEAIINRL
jgi:hypothetical protein